MTRKRKVHFKDDPANLKRFRDEIMHLSEPKTKDSNVEYYKHDKSEFSLRGKKKLPRKMKRKEERHMKKARKLAHYQGKQMPKVEDQLKKKKEEEKIERKQKNLEKLKKKKKKSKEKKKEKLKMEEEMKKEDMLAAIQREEKMLKQLSKQLHLNKRKSKTLPQSFLNDGLDYLLDVVDKDKVSALYEDSDIEDEATSGNIDESNSDQEVSDEMDDKKSDDVEDDQQKKKAIDEIMSHLKKSEAKSILKTSKTVKKDKTLSNVKFYEDNDEGEADVEDDFSDEDENLDDVDENLSDDDKDVDEDEEDENLDVQNLSEDDEEDLHNLDHDESEDEKILNRKLKHSQEETDSNESDDVLSEGNSDIEAVTKLHHKKGDKPESKLKEDIYGRLRDSEGNVVTMATGSYIPPAKRLAMADTMDEKKKLKMERLKKQLKGLINRTSEANMGPIISQIETIYTTNSRGDVNESLRDIIMESTVSSMVTPERLAMELMMLVAILNNNVGMEVGGLFIQQLAWKLKASWEDLEGKYLDNIVLLFSHLYNFKVIHCILIFDIIRKFVERFTEKDIELILLVLRSVGFSLRKDDPHTLKDIILLIQGKASSLDKTESSRVQFMLDVLLAIKNNNMRKIPNYDPEKCEQMKKSARNHVKTSLGTNQLRIGLEDLMNAEDKGHWWVIGSAWEGRSDKHEDVRQTVQTTILGEASDKILELARKQRMNTGIRKSIFCSIMTSEDYIDAFEKLLRLGLKNQQERELIHVITDCCLQEKSYNQFYAYLLQKFCEYDRRFQMTFQFMMWDKFKEMSHQSEQSRNNLGKIVVHLMVTKSISLSVFKVVEFGTLDKNMVRFLKQVLQEILLDHADHVMQEVFSRIAPLTKLHLLHEGLKLFMRHFLVGKKSKQDQNKLLVERVSLAEKALSAGHSKFQL
ncbi:nucleolar MIF4G domain-containing protein 1-like isoform X11 [Mytilus californianus]|uniref:nucleolar MIF4G domain-containing protein 1-like isoform X6 n=1 Tax=Mytilus californianus TaxID=6549 RepID=UPI002246062B|nr:nucleolar MIF4G domain-containing protein 1-like isoform X6 [Mytilus californianus]XP_052096196.1 nucleolar MIF4G domain-containing protein 1-like isoform X7 [Mytilus californianus]XP_052096197.1 nucleolar MIF4G domain-containing protein 1-like isoform X8 [Mytilus californianus]XP_052096199.1 nucleolar MIF4G domain-containing protein 1-like isoform X9 [Mytilus californianus]XP_052096200.1 nucleolar MIF4G domain-containing protein 1-like isoform X10 [Mytilus californianus]XP_052096201.1 nucl